jgi:methionyl aminopeptidase
MQSSEKRKVYYKTNEEIELIRQSCLLVSDVLAYCTSIIKMGMTGLELDAKAEEYIRDHGAIPAFKGYGRDFPGSLCISTNESVVHGLPDNKPFQDGDIVSLDTGVLMNGFYGDSAYTLAIGDVNAATIDLLRVTKTALLLGIEHAIAGKRLGDLGFAIFDYCERLHGHGIVRDLVGHGIGRDLHEEPNVLNHGKRGSGMLLKEGLVIAVEPMVNMKSKEVTQMPDYWTILTRDRKPSAHYEHTVAVRKLKVDILSTFEPIEVAERNNPELLEITIKN